MSAQTAVPILLLAVAALMQFGIWVPEARGASASRGLLTALWIFTLVAWPLISRIAVGPLLWGDPSNAPRSLYSIVEDGPAAALGVLLLIQRFRSPFEINVPTLITALLSLATLITGASPIPALFSVGILAATFFCDREITLDQIASACRFSLFALTLVVLLMVATNPALALQDCRVDKCNVFGTALTSTFTGNGNIFGLGVAIALPFAAIGMGPFRVFLLIASAAIFQELSLSRTAIAAFVIASLLSLMLSARHRSRFSGPALSVTLILSFVYSTLPFISPFSGADYSLRGYLWQRAFQLISVQPVFGYGANYWTGIGDSATFTANYSPHNIWLTILVAFGVVGVAIQMAALASLLIFSRAEARLWVAVSLSTVLAVGALESPWSPYTLSILPAASALPLLLSSVSSGPRWLPSTRSIRVTSAELRLSRSGL